MMISDDGGDDGADDIISLSKKNNKSRLSFYTPSIVIITFAT
jgi:hypothetical protein